MSTIDFLRKQAASLDLPSDDTVSVFLRVVAHAHAEQVRQLLAAVAENLLSQDPMAELREFLQGVTLTARITREELADVLVGQSMLLGRSGTLKEIYWDNISHESRLALENAARQRNYVDFDPHDLQHP